VNAMISKKTGLVIGAGASKAYGLPVGIELRKEIFNMRANSDYLSSILGISWYRSEKFIQFIDSFYNSGIKSIDKYLKFHPEYEKEGKACITYLIKKHELVAINELSKNDWLLELYDKLIDGISSINESNEIKRNHLYIVTFNYDRLIEFFLIRSYLNSFSNDKKVKVEFLKYSFSDFEGYFGFSIDHIYGMIGNLDLNPMTEDDEKLIEKTFHEIKLIGDRSSNIEQIKEKLGMCQRIIVWN
jgi:hypothetical protein